MTSTETAERTTAWEAISADRVIAVVRAQRVPDPAGVAEAFATSGIRCVEFTFTIPGVLDVIRRAVEGAETAIVGAGTVMDDGQASAAVLAGARFVVSPVLRPSLVTSSGGVPVFLGAFTPTEAVAAMEAGATAVKLFPAATVGPTFVRALRGPLPDVPLIPSGGVTDDTAGEYLAAGAVAVYAGSSIAPVDAIESGDLDRITSLARAFTEALPKG